MVNNPENIQRKTNMNNNNINYDNNILQPGKQNNIFVNTNNNYNNNELHYLPFSYTQMYNINNNINNNNPNPNQRINLENNIKWYEKNNYNNTYFDPNQKNSSLINNNNQNTNYRGNIGNINSINSNNIKNYPNFKENIYMNNQINDKGKIIYA